AVAGYRVRVQVIGEAMAATLTRALRPEVLAATKSPQELTVQIWDSGEIADLRPPPPRPDLGTYGLISATAGGRFVLDERPNGFLILDRVLGRIVGHYAGVGSLFLDERARPFHRLLSVWLGDRAVQFIHAGVVSVNGASVVLAGGGGSGKSTTSLL